MTQRAINTILAVLIAGVPALAVAGVSTPPAASHIAVAASTKASSQPLPPKCTHSAGGCIILY